MDGRTRVETGRTSKLTYEDFLLFPDDGRRHELIDGEHYVTPSPNTRHQDLLLRLTLALGNYLAEDAVGRLFFAPFDCVFTNWDIVEPDLLFIAADQLDIITDKHVRGAPALVVEILSKGTRKVDERTKRALYDRVGVREYWVINPDLDTVQVFRRAPDGSFPSVATLSAPESGVLTTPLLPRFSFLLADFFRRE